MMNEKKHGIGHNIRQAVLVTVVLLVLCGLEDRLDALLPALAGAGAGPECLKAVLTPHNCGWSVLRLHRELLRERQAMEGRA